jgi:pimeloyl-ACP methyl ester carboxylesterase
MSALDKMTPDRFRRLQDEFLDGQGVDAESRFYDLEVDLSRGPKEIATHLLLAGPEDGAPLLLVHGGRSLGAEWAPLVAQLQDKYRLIVPDYPGRGLTEKLNYRRVDFREIAREFVRALLDQLSLSEVVLVGNSMGGYFSLAFVTAYPDPVDQMVLVGAPAGIDKWVPPFRRLMGVRGINWLLSKTTARPTRDGLREAYAASSVADPSRISEDYLDFKYASQVLPGVQKSWYTALEQLITLRGFADRYYLRDELPNIETATLFIWGRADAFAPPESGEAASQMMPDARIEVVDDAGHIVWLDQPERCAELVREFVG